MKTIFIALFIVTASLVFASQSLAQFTSEELAERVKWEEFLKNAKIVEYEKIPEGVTKPLRLYLKKGEVERSGAWKNAEGKPRGYLESWKYEIAAYRLDKYLELNMVPPTVERRFKGNRGSCQLWVEYWIKANKKNEEKIKVPSYKIFHWNRATYLRWAFDNLIANEDRHAGNFFITKDWRIILPDHSRSFRSTKKFTKKLIYTEKHKEGPKIMKELPRAFVEKIKVLDFELIKEIVGEYLTDKEINAVLTRKELMLQEIDKFIKQYGEDKVLY